MFVKALEVDQNEGKSASGESTRVPKIIKMNGGFGIKIKKQRY